MSTDAERFDAFIHAVQYPRNCGASVGFFQKQDYFWGLGLGAQMVALKFGLLSALLQRAVYHMPTTHYANPLRCPSRSFDCYFERPTNCTRETHGRAVDVGIRWCFDVPAGKLSALAALSRVYPKEWYQARLAAFLFRPNAALSHFVRSVEVGLDRSDPLSNGSRAIAAAAREVRQARKSSRPTSAKASKGRGGRAQRLGGRTSLRRLDGSGAEPAAAVPRRRLAQAIGGGGGGWAINGSCVAVHVRRTDKFKTNRREDHHPMRSFSEYAQLFKSYEYWRRDGTQPQVSLLVGSEDKKTFTHFPPLVAPARSFWLPSHLFVMDAFSKVNSFKSIRQGNSRLGELYRLVGERAKERGLGPAQVAAAAASGDADASLLLKDEGMVLIAQILLMAGCEAFIGSYASNVAVLLHDLMAAKRLAAQLPLHAMDVNGRVYCGCGASFCMTLERKAVRDPTRSVKDIIDSFRQ